MQLYSGKRADSNVRAEQLESLFILCTTIPND